MTTTPRETAVPQLSSAWWRIPWYDPGPPWWFNHLDQELQREIAAEQLNTMKEHLQTQVKSIERQVQILAKKR